MKKIIISAFTIFAAVAAVAGATAAVFSDTESITGNTVGTGTLNLTVNHSAGKPFNVTGAYPGYVSGWEHLDIFNGPYPGQPGQLPFEAEMALIETGGNHDLWKMLTIEMKTSGWDSDCTNGDNGENTIYSGLVRSFPNGMTVSDIAYWHNANEDDGTGPPDNIRAGWSERICQRVGVHSSAGNNVQGTSVTFTEKVDAVQDND